MERQEVRDEDPGLPKARRWGGLPARARAPLAAVGASTGGCRTRRPPPPQLPGRSGWRPRSLPRRTWLSAAGMPDSSSHSARKLCSSKSASTWREKVTSERSLRTQYTVSSMARARPGSARPGLGAGRRAAGDRGPGRSCGRAAGAGCSLARSFPPSHARSDSLAPALSSQRGRRHPPARPSACRPASHRCRQARGPPGAPPRRNATAVKHARLRPPSRRSGVGRDWRNWREEWECGGGEKPRLEDGGFNTLSSGVQQDPNPCYSSNRLLLCAWRAHKKG